MVSGAGGLQEGQRGFSAFLGLGLLSSRRGRFNYKHHQGLSARGRARADSLWEERFADMSIPF